jgi:hypothetical protein
MRNRYFILIFSLLLAAACKHKEVASEDVKAEDVQTPVTVTSVESVPLMEYTDLNATSSYLQTNFIKASTNGYLESVHVHLGEFIGSGQLAFTLKTKEAKALGNTINALDTSFHFSGVIHIKASAGGYIRELNHQAGDYVQDGEQLAVLSDSKSFGFLLNLPYELRRFVSTGQSMDIELPDGNHLKGNVASIMQRVDSVSQTQAVLIRVNPGMAVPENLIGKVRIVKSQKAAAASLPKGAILTDEAQTNFWVMKMIDSVRAVKVPVIKGMETSDRVEIIRPQFSANDKILLTGNYGLPDTARVKIMKAEQ